MNADGTALKKAKAVPVVFENNTAGYMQMPHVWLRVHAATHSSIWMPGMYMYNLWLPRQRIKRCAEQACRQRTRFTGGFENRYSFSAA